MTPSQSDLHLPNRARTDTEPLSKCSLTKSAGTNQNNVIIGQFGQRMARTANMTISDEHIVNILKLGTDSQMRGLDANRSIARVQNTHPTRDRPDEDFVTDTVSQQTGSARIVDFAIPPVCERSHPIPTHFFVRWFAWHKPTKRFNRGLASWSHGSQRIWVAVSTHALIMQTAPSLCMHRTVAIFYRARLNHLWSLASVRTRL